MKKKPTRARVCAETRTCGSDSPSRSKSRALSITPLHHPQKRRLNDGLQAHAIRSTRESSEDVTRTLDAPPSKVRADIFFPTPQRATSQTVEAPNPWRQTREIINPEEEGSEYKYKYFYLYLYIPILLIGLRA